MNKWWNWIFGAIVIGLLFLAIPLRYSADDDEVTREQLRSNFEEYIKKHNKTYKNNSVEYEKRFGHFMESLKEIDRLNAAEKDGNIEQALYGLTYLSDMSQDEFRNIHLSDEKISYTSNIHGGSRSKYKKHVDRYSYNLQHKSKDDDTSDGRVYERRKRLALPLQVDWRDKGVISSVKNQGVCGACWAFSTVATMEAMAAINTGKLVELSVQEMIDCAALGNSGCSGGDICLLLAWLVKTDTGVVPAAQYPLRLINGSCRLQNKSEGLKVDTFSCDSMLGDEQQLLETLARHGPVAVAVNALTWQNYLGGVIQYHCSGKPGDLNHAVQLVGYNMNTNVPYYMAKNSWGQDFGEDGYVKLAIGNNICGLANEVGIVDVRV